MKSFAVATVLGATLIASVALYSYYRANALWRVIEPL